jgi:hypothetical protein
MGTRRPSVGYPSAVGYPPTVGYPAIGIHAGAHAGAHAGLQTLQPAVDARMQSTTNHQISKQQAAPEIQNTSMVAAPQVRSAPPQTRSAPAMAVNRQLLELQEEHDQVLDGLAAELEEVELKLDATTRELSQTHHENRAWQELGWAIAEDLERQKGIPITQPRRPYGERERAHLHSDVQLFLEALNLTQDQADETKRESKAMNKTLKVQAQEVETLQKELAAAQSNVVNQQQQRSLADQTDELRRRCDFFKHNSEQLTEQVRDLSTANEGMKDAARAKDNQIRELQQLLSSFGYQ